MCQMNVLNYVSNNWLYIIIIHVHVYIIQVNAVPVYSFVIDKFCLFAP